MRYCNILTASKQAGSLVVSRSFLLSNDIILAIKALLRREGVCRKGAFLCSF